MGEAGTGDEGPWPDGFVLPPSVLDSYVIGAFLLSEPSQMFIHDQNLLGSTRCALFY